ncbi:hypothetical protein BGZ73_004361 [Actinomortierella ambigua]|nr:hypothetical protein BGZ73_004361 [Actinomortierella ambigua]
MTGRKDQNHASKLDTSFARAVEIANGDDRSKAASNNSHIHVFSAEERFLSVAPTMASNSSSSNSRRDSTSSVSSTATITPSRSSLSLYPTSPLLASPFAGAGFRRSSTFPNSPPTPSFAPSPPSLLSTLTRSTLFRDEPLDSDDDRGAESAVESIDGVSETETETETETEAEESSSEEDDDGSSSISSGEEEDSNNVEHPSLARISRSLSDSLPPPPPPPPFSPSPPPYAHRPPPPLPRASSVPSLSPVSPVGERQNHLYGAYKQATVGDAKGSSASVLDDEAWGKWQAWANLTGKSKEEAKAIYVDIVHKALKRAAVKQPELYSLVDDTTRNPEDTSSSHEKPTPVSNKKPSAAQGPRSMLVPKKTASTLSLPTNSIDSNRQLTGSHPIPERHSSYPIASTVTGLRSAASSVYELASDQLIDPPTSETEGKSVGGQMKDIEESKEHEYEDDEEEDDNDVYQSSEEYGDEDEIAAEHEAARVAEEEAEQQLLQQQQQQQERDRVLDSTPSSPVLLLPPSTTARREAKDMVDEGVFDEEDKIEQEAAVVQLQQEDDRAGLGGGSSSSNEDAEAGADVEDPEVAVLMHGRNSPEAVVLDTTTTTTSTTSTTPTAMTAVEDTEDENALGMTGLGSLAENETTEPLFKQGYSPTTITTTTTTTTKSRTSSVSSSGYGSSSTRSSSKSPSPVLEQLSKDSLWSLSASPQPLSKAADAIRMLPPVAAAEPYVVRSMTEVSHPSLSQQQQDRQDVDQGDKAVAVASAAVSPSSPSTRSPVSSASFHPEGAVCPVTKKTTADGMCPAAMFAMARQAGSQNSANGKGDASSLPHLPGITRTPPLPSTPPSPGATETLQPAALPSSSSSSSSSASGPPHHSQSEPVRPGPSSQRQPPTSSRLGQGFVSRISALRSSLAAASARAASSALSSFPSSSSSKATAANGGATEEATSTTVVCPHGATTAVLEKEVEQLQNEVTALSEQLHLLQESLERRSQNQRLEKRSARGIFKMVLRQGLINAVLLLLVFAVLYKRKSPIAFAILAYVGQGRREGEAGWRAFMRWCGQMVRVGRRNQRLVLSAGRRNGYW